MLGKDWVVCQMLQKLLLQADTRMIPSVEICQFTVSDTDDLNDLLNDGAPDESDEA